MSTIKSNSPKSLAYVVSQYPMLSMIFIIREVLQLKKIGFNIDVASINAPDRGIKDLVVDEANEANLTYYVKPHGIKGALIASIKTLLRHPAGYFKGLKLILSLGQLDINNLFFNLMYFVEALMVGVWMQEKQHKHLHAHLGSQAMTVALYVKTIFNFSISATVHGPDEFYDASGQYLTQKVIAADFIICISYFARSQLMKLSPYEHWHKLEVSRLGVDPNVFSPQSFKTTNPDVFEVICVGRLTPAKGQHILVEAIDRLIRQGKNIRLRIVGNGEDRPSLEGQIKKLGLESHIILEGAVNQDRIRTLYAGADVFCIPSFAEGIPVVLMEAMAMEIPCVTTRITGIPELIQSGENGVLVAPSNVDELAEALTTLMKEPSLREKLGKNARKQITEHYDLAKNIDILAQIFEKRLSKLP